MEDIISEVSAALRACTHPGIVWPRGLMHPGGPHFRVSISVSIGGDECAVFGKLIERFRPEHGFIVGNAFGFSCAVIARCMMKHGGRSLISLDPRTEGDGERCARIADELVRRLELTIVRNKRGFSPQDIPQAVETDLYDLIFIDGLHAHPQVSEDFLGCLPYAGAQAIFVWHDFWLPGIPECIELAREKGFYCWWIPTSCEMVIATRDEDRFRAIEQMFPEGSANVPDRSALAQLRAGAYALTCRETGRFLDWLYRHRARNALKM